jgi:biofilm protein TabA
VIVDKIENTHLYSQISPRISKALELLKDKKVFSQPEGKYEIDSRHLYYLVSKYTTKALTEGKLEAHRKYLDLHFIVAGEEMLPYTNIADPDLTISTPYMDENEATLYHVPSRFTAIRLYKGMFVIFFPEDAHLPARIINKPSQIHKIIVKVAL